MTKMLKCFVFVITILFTAFNDSTSAQLSINGPLLTDSTIVQVSTTISTSVKGTPCFTTVAPVTECRRKRGIEEKALIIKFDEDSQDIDPSQVLT